MKRQNLVKVTRPVYSNVSHNNNVILVHLQADYDGLRAVLRHFFLSILASVYAVLIKHSMRVHNVNLSMELSRVSKRPKLRRIKLSINISPPYENYTFLSEMIRFILDHAYLETFELVE